MGHLKRPSALTPILAPINPSMKSKEKQIAKLQKVLERLSRDEIIEYERRLKAATFAYNKADSKSQKGHRSAKKMFGASDTLFERLSEYLTEKMAGNGALEIWFDRPLATGAEDSFGLDPDSFPKIITSRSLNNKSGGTVRQNYLRSDERLYSVF